MMQRYLRGVCIGLLFNMICFHGLSQSLERKVFSSAGGKTTSAPYYFSFTLGEPIVGTDDLIIPNLTKGFEQPIDPSILEISRIQESFEEEDLSFNVYPNPAKDHIQLAYHSSRNGEKELILFEPSGKVVFRKKVDKERLAQGIRVELSKLAGGTYYLLCSDQGKQSVISLRVE